MSFITCQSTLFSVAFEFRRNMSDAMLMISSSRSRANRRFRSFASNSSETPFRVSSTTPIAARICAKRSPTDGRASESGFNRYSADNCTDSTPPLAVPNALFSLWISSRRHQITVPGGVNDEP